ncbi:hypothetical protein SAY86_023870 [Trapa natans]|uniref:Uncharacterized protein n=1 Tax=Trapa natans TaxID=22666 RepID=A0AAN7MBF0_TRANT|nr:hypothetical protein SAY86_023870 [Trapa natans]
MPLTTRSTAPAPSAATPAESDASSSSSVGDRPHDEAEPETPKNLGGDGRSRLQRPPSMSQRALLQTLSGSANLANLLPTGTLLAFQLLTPIFTNNGTCDAATRPMTIVLLVVLAASCFLACFTDSVMASDGQVYYGFATSKGMFLFDTAATAAPTRLPDLRRYRWTFIDWLHAILSVLAFGAVALRDRNVMTCLDPTPGKEALEVLKIVPFGIGLICSFFFMIFPTRRHGIGYPVTPGQVAHPIKMD